MLRPGRLVRNFLLALLAAVAWSLVGVGVAASTGTTNAFLQEWLRLQVPLVVAAAVFLNLVVVSSPLEQLLEQLVPAHKVTSLAGSAASGRRRRARKASFEIALGLVGSASLIGLGFNASGPTLYFMWLTAVGLSFLAGPPTWHVVEMTEAAQILGREELDLFSYSPGESGALRAIAQYFAFYGLAISISYVFAFLGTNLGSWTADKVLVRCVQVFWPLVYVPICLAVLIYPHVTIYSRVRREKDRVIERLQRQIDGMLTSGESLTREDVERINSLATLIENIEKTPNHSFSFPVAGSTVGSIALNLGSLLFPHEVLIALLRQYLTFLP